MRANALPRALLRLVTVGVVSLMAFASFTPAQAVDLQVAYVTPAELTPELAAARQQPSVQLRPSFGSTGTPALTNDLLAAYVQKQQAMKSFSGFDVQPTGALNEQVLLGYIDRTRTKNNALDAIDSFADQPALTTDVLSTYAKKGFVPTVRKVQLSILTCNQIPENTCQFSGSSIACDQAPDVSRQRRPASRGCRRSS